MWDFIGWSRRIILAAMAWGVWSKIYSLPLLKKIFCFVFWLHHWFSGWQYLINSIPLSRATSLGDPMARGPGATIPRRLLIIICKKRTQQYFFSRQNIIVFESTELELEWPKECLIVPRKMREVPFFSAQCGHHSASCQMEFHLNESWRRSSYFGKWKEKSEQHRVSSQQEKKGKNHWGGP